MPPRVPAQPAALRREYSAEAVPSGSNEYLCERAVLRHRSCVARVDLIPVASPGTMWARHDAIYGESRHGVGSWRVRSSAESMAWHDRRAAPLHQRLTIQRRLEHPRKRAKVVVVPAVRACVGGWVGAWRGADPSQCLSSCTTDGLTNSSASSMITRSSGRASCCNRQHAAWQHATCGRQHATGDNHHGRGGPDGPRVPR